MKSALLSILSLCLVSFAMMGASARAELKFGVVPTESAANLRRDYEPLRGDLEAALGQPVEMYFAADYTSMIEAMRFGHIQLAHLGNQSGIDAVDRAQGEVFAQVIDDGGQAGYYSHIVVHRDAPWQTLDELLVERSKVTFSLGDHQSTSGTLVPAYYAFGLKGVEPSREFKALRQGNHEANLFAVANRQVDAATASSEALFRLRQNSPDVLAKIRVIWQSPLIASDPLIYRRDLAPELKARLREFFLAYGDAPEERARLAPLKLSGFRASDDRQLLPYRLLRVLREQAKLEQDTQLSAAEKARRRAELTARREAVEKQLNP